MKTKSLILTTIVSTLLLGTLNLDAMPQANPEGSQVLAELERLVYPPDLVLRFQREIGISDEQRKSIRDLSLATASYVNEIQWDMQESVRTMMELLANNASASEAVITQLESVLAHEAQVKLAHMKLVLEIRDLLTPDQRSQLDSLRPKRLRDLLTPN